MIWVNGKAGEYQPGSNDLALYNQRFYGSKNSGCTGPTYPPLPRWDQNPGGLPNAIRIGEVSDMGLGGGFPRNYSPDMTIDELFMWRIMEVWGETSNNIVNEVSDLRRGASLVWAAGRYYKPTDDAAFTSAPIHLQPRDRAFTPAGASGGTMTGSDGGSAPIASSGKTQAAGKSRSRLMGVSWTWYAEDYSRIDGSPVIIDHGGPFGTQDAPGGGYSVQGYYGQLECQPVQNPNLKYDKDLERVVGKVLKQDGSMVNILLQVVDGQGNVKRELAGPNGLGFVDSGFSQTIDPVTGQSSISIEEGDALRYVVRFRIQGMSQDTVLLSSPVFDDITFYFADSEAEYLSWRLVNTTA